MLYRYIWAATKLEDTLCVMVENHVNLFLLQTRNSHPAFRVNIISLWLPKKKKINSRRLETQIYKKQQVKNAESRKCARIIMCDVIAVAG